MRRRTAYNGRMRAQAQFVGTPVAAAPLEERLAFIKQTYAHLGGAVAAFILIEVLLFRTGVAEAASRTILSSRFGWLAVLGGFMLIGWLADRWAHAGQSRSVQYAGLGIYVLAEALVFMPLLWIASVYSPDAIPTAAIITLIIFGGLTAIVFVTKKDFSWLRNVLYVGGFVALGLIVASILFGFTLGIVFAAVMVAFAAAYILYYTSNILHKYPVGAHVSASLALFASVALLFWYVLRIVMDRR